jgi:hypothetical protein
MKGNKHMKTMMSIIYPAFALFAFACFAFLPTARAVVPPPDGGYPNFTTAEGDKALFSLTTGAANTSVGWYSLFSDTEGSFNTATGAGALLFNTTASANTALGTAALLFNTIGFNNTALGAAALLNNTEGGNNTATGTFALQNNTTGAENTAMGSEALSNSTENVHNTAVGYQALSQNTQDDNTGIGWHALFGNSTGYGNTACGVDVLGLNSTGSFNTAIGFTALLHNTEGTNNTAVGREALANNTDGSFNTALGDETLINLASGSGNVAIGAGTGSDLTTGDGNIYVGNPGVTTETATIRIGVPEHGAAFIGGISGTAVVGDTVVVDANGQLGTATSSARFKKEIRPMDKTSEAILALKPVSFQYKSDSKGTSQFGLIAEEVAKVNPDLVIRDRKGEIYSVRYEAVNAMLLNEFLKEHRKVQDLEANDAAQQQEIKALAATVKEQALQIQKVSAQLELQKPPAQTVAENQ